MYTTLINPSCPGWVSMIRPKSQWWGWVLYSEISTKVPNSMLSYGLNHLCRSWSEHKYFLDLLHQKLCWTAWILFQRFRDPILNSSSFKGSGKLFIGLPIRKWLGVKAAKSSGSDNILQNGLEFITAFIWATAVVNSLYVNDALLRWMASSFLAILIRLSHAPPKWGERGGRNESWLLL